MAKLIKKGGVGWFFRVGGKDYPLGYAGIPEQYDGAKVPLKEGDEETIDISYDLLHKIGNIETSTMGEDRRQVAITIKDRTRTGISHNTIEGLKQSISFPVSDILYNYKDSGIEVVFTENE